MRSSQFVFLLMLPVLAVACGSDDDSSGGSGGTGGSTGGAGSGGKGGGGGSAGKSSTGGTNAGTGASAGTENTAGTPNDGVAGEGGSAPIGEGGVAGEAPTARLDIPDFPGVPEPVKDVVGQPADTVLSATLTASAVARGVTNVENPIDAHLKGAAGGVSVQVTKYGYWGDNADLTLATKSEADKNTY